MENSLNKTSVEDRIVKAEWCQLLGGRHIDYYMNLTDDSLEKEYLALTERASNYMKK